MPGILDDIVESKQNEVDSRKQEVERERLQERSRQWGPSLSLARALEADGLQLIAEIKPKAPSSGQLTELSVNNIARVYQNECPAAVSVLTDYPYFGMSLDDFNVARELINKPVLRKEFIIDPFQIYESAAIGADAILLIAAILSPDQMQKFYQLAGEQNLECIVEVHTLDEIRNLPFEPSIVGINNRTLSGDFQTDISVTERLVDAVPSDSLAISESGIECAQDVNRLRSVSGVEGILVGSSILRDVNDTDTIIERIRTLMDSGTV